MADFEDYADNELECQWDKNKVNPLEHGAAIAADKIILWT
jgi:hypothetical protein